MSDRDLFGKPPAREGIAAKVDYVKSQGQTRRHHCHWPGCKAQVPPAMWGCRAHWYQLPKHLRDRIWRTFKPGQEISATPSQAYLQAARDVQAWIASHSRQNAGDDLLKEGKEHADR